MTTWLIRVSGYGTFEFEGTEAEAEEIRRHKANWEQGTAMKWRSDLSLESDRLTAQIAEYFDAGKGCPSDLIQKRAKALKAEQTKAAEAVS